MNVISTAVAVHDSNTKSLAFLFMRGQNALLGYVYDADDDLDFVRLHNPVQVVTQPQANGQFTIMLTNLYGMRGDGYEKREGVYVDVDRNAVNYVVREPDMHENLSSLYMQHLTGIQLAQQLPGRQ